MKFIILTVLVCFAIGTNAIIEGNYAKDQSAYPFTLYFYDERFHDEKEPICAATILNEEYLLTAAHCCHDKWLAPYEPYIPKYVNVRGEDQAIEIEQAFRHPKYNRTSFYTCENDVAIIKLKTPLNLTSNKYERACLDENYQKFYEGTFNIKGYGSILPVRVGKNGQDELREGQVADVTPTAPECKEKSNFLICVTGNQTHGSRNPTNLCFGDTGYGLVKDINGKLKVVGVVGMPNGVYKTEMTGFCYTGNIVYRISAYIDFIRKYVGNDYCH